MSDEMRSLGRSLSVLTLLRRADFIHGVAPSEIARELRIPASSVTRITQRLIEDGYAERIPETGRLRMSHGLARDAVRLLQSLDDASRRLAETRQRLEVLL